MSRLYVAQLPFKTTEQKIRNHFKPFGTITDVRMKLKDGKFTGTCFIGYSTEEEARKALEQLNNTYFNNIKLVIDFAHGTTAHKKERKEKKPIQTSVHKSDNPFRIKIRTSQTLKEKGAKVFTRQLVGQFIAPVEPKKIIIPKNVPFAAFVDLNSEEDVQKCLRLDKSFMAGARVNVYRPQTAVEKPAVDDKTAKWAKQEEKLKDAKPVGESGSLFVRNLCYTITREELEALFEPFGKIVDITVPLTKVTHQSKGFAHVTFMFPEHAVTAMNQLDNTVFQGRLLHILPSLKTQEEATPKTFKEEKEQKLKSRASSWHNWNMLFVGSNAVIDIICKKYNISKNEVLNNEGNKSLAARIALEETQIVTNTQRFLEENGVCLEAFAKPNMARSKTVFLVKDLPAGTTANQLSEVFSPFGELMRVVLPESGLTAIVEFQDEFAAKKAFKAKAYRLFNNLPLYLEWAPVETFDAEAKSKSTEESDQTTEKKKEKKDTPDPNSTLYITNLSFDTTEEGLRSHFAIMGEVCKCVIAMQKGLSQGFGFVQFLKSAHARKALLKMQDTCLDGHILSVKMSEKVLKDDIPNYRKIQDFGKQASSVIMVKNIPFQSTVGDVRQIFANFGVVKKVRMPMKSTYGTEHRGFGFVEFETLEDAKNAFDHLRVSTHLLGRRLALEWAKGEETVSEMQKRTADHFLDSDRSKKRKKLDETLLGSTAMAED